MYQMLLVDDEIHTRKGIKACIEWRRIGIDTIYGASNIRKAKEILQNNKIHIMICDIEMPQGSGLELLKWLSDNRFNVVSILLTCHADFNYARRAVGLGVLDYMLKPVNSEQLEMTIKKAISIIERNRGKIISEKQNTENIAEEQQDIPLIKSIKEYIEDNMSGDLSKEKIALEFHFSPDYLSKVFKHETGYTLSEYLFYERIQVAKELLMNSDMPISDIVSFIGYSNFSHFSKIFKKTTGVTPLKFRKCKGNQ